MVDAALQKRISGILDTESLTSATKRNTDICEAWQRLDIMSNALSGHWSTALGKMVDLLEAKYKKTPAAADTAGLQRRAAAAALTRHAGGASQQVGWLPSVGQMWQRSSPD